MKKLEQSIEYTLREAYLHAENNMFVILVFLKNEWDEIAS